jgi:hypothetical protein
MHNTLFVQVSNAINDSLDLECEVSYFVCSQSIGIHTMDIRSMSGNLAM